MLFILDIMKKQLTKFGCDFFTWALIAVLIIGGLMVVFSASRWWGMDPQLFNVIYFLTLLPLAVLLSYFQEKKEQAWMK